MARNLHSKTTIEEAGAKEAYEFLKTEILKYKPDEDVDSWEKVKKDDGFIAFNAMVKFADSKVEIKEREYKEKLKELRSKYQEMIDNDSEGGLREAIQILDKAINDKK